MLVAFRFWLNDHYETIGLAEGEIKAFNTGGPNEEGYSYTHYTFTYEGDLVRLEISTTARDCDGRLDSYRELTCPIDKLEGYKSHDGVMTPDWQKVDEHQRDYSAEAAGY